MAEEGVGFDVGRAFGVCVFFFFVLSGLDGLDVAFTFACGRFAIDFFCAGRFFGAAGRAVRDAGRGLAPGRVRRVVDAAVLVVRAAGAGVRRRFLAAAAGRLAVVVFLVVFARRTGRRARAGAADRVRGLVVFRALRARGVVRERVFGLLAAMTLPPARLTRTP
ncbi:MAG: hypothetical protein ABS36_10140 [Acidobacteria bacterium SCN 69-37]|nr:MAG: hypothetical protein ABS36_10140 [Acidobacteria bacterium SCN 69-37]